MIAHKPGFTLIELLAVVAIISILLAAVLVVAPSLRERAQLRDAESRAWSLLGALQAFRARHGVWPGQNDPAVDGRYTSQAEVESALAAVSNALRIHARSLSGFEAIPFRDSWGQPMIVAYAGSGDATVTLEYAHQTRPLVSISKTGEVAVACAAAPMERATTNTWAIAAGR